MMMEGLVDDQHVVNESLDTSQTDTITSQVVSGGQNMAVSQPGVSIVHVSIPSGQQNNSLHSVIQANQQSVIQSTPSVGYEDDGEDESAKKRREILARRPSYRKILNELASGDSPNMNDKDDDGTDGQMDPHDMNSGTITVSNAQTYQTPAGILKVMPSGAIQIASSQGDSIQGLQSLTGGGGTIVQYAQSQDGQQFLVPVSVSASDLQAYQIRTASGQTVSSSSTGTTATLPQGVVMATASIQSPQQLAEDVHRKREVRLLKNREAAKECRRKKKEYIKCLENRVAVLETQNKALIDELKSLKELYCQKTD